MKVHSQTLLSDEQAAIMLPSGEKRADRISACKGGKTTRRIVSQGVSIKAAGSRSK